MAGAKGQDSQASRRTGLWQRVYVTDAKGKRRRCHTLALDIKATAYLEASANFRNPSMPPETLMLAPPKSTGCKHSMSVENRECCIVAACGSMSIAKVRPVDTLAMTLGEHSHGRPHLPDQLSDDLCLLSPTLQSFAGMKVLQGISHSSRFLRFFSLCKLSSCVDSLVWLSMFPFV